MEVGPHFSDKAKEDYKLVIAASDGNQNAYTELLKRYKDSIYFMLLKMVNNPIDAEDLTIEAFGKAFKNIQQYSPSFAFSTWLFKIATNNCIDFLRKKTNNHISIHSQNEHGEVEESVHLTTTDLDPEESMIKDQKAKLMREVVEQLKPRYRKLIELRYFKEFSYEEIAINLDLPLGTVKAQLFRARELLYNILKKKEHRI
ncbi:MAG: sigma-70 family RNA polymerase sigma factor [Chlorobi bacterium]|nr:sigma-70 family RNA polymerase sigma factor [Chlorobiota bacterium]